MTTEAFKIETDVPLPMARGGKVTSALRALAAATIGSSVLLRTADRNSITSVAHHLGGPGWASMRKQPDGTYRVWKIAEPHRAA